MLLFEPSYLQQSLFLTGNWCNSCFWANLMYYFVTKCAILSPLNIACMQTFLWMKYDLEIIRSIDLDFLICFRYCRCKCLPYTLYHVIIINCNILKMAILININWNWYRFVVFMWEQFMFLTALSIVDVYKTHLSLLGENCDKKLDDLS